MGTVKKIVIFIVLILYFFICFLQPAEPVNNKTVVSMDINEYKTYLKINPALDRLYIKDNRAFFLVDQTEIDLLQKSGIRSFKINNSLSAGPSLKTAGGDVNGLYHSYAETEALLSNLAAQYPDLASVINIGTSIEGRNLTILKISDNVGVEEAEPNVFILGCHHAREWISVEMPLLFAQSLLENYASSSDIQNAVNGSQIFIMPIQNPDGLEYSIHTYRLWRKNRRYNGDVSWGVDTNRNYGFMWGYDNQGSSPDPDSQVYRGTAPFSEPENRAVADFMLSHPPAGVISYHNYGQVILFPWGYITESTVDDAEMRAIAKKMSELIFQVNGRTYAYGSGAEALYTTNGGFVDWVYGTFNVPAYTIELPAPNYYYGGFFTSETEIGTTFNENLPLLLYFVNYFINAN